METHVRILLFGDVGSRKIDLAIGKPIFGSETHIISHKNYLVHIIDCREQRPRDTSHHFWNHPDGICIFYSHKVDDVSLVHEAYNCGKGLPIMLATHLSDSQNDKTIEAMDYVYSRYDIRTGFEKWIPELINMAKRKDTHKAGFFNQIFAKWIEKQKREKNEKYKGLPPELYGFKKTAINTYRETLAKGKIKNYEMNFMIVGHTGVGKTTITSNLVMKCTVEKGSTDGIDIHTRKCIYNREKQIWVPATKDQESDITKLYRQYVQILRNNQRQSEKVERQPIKHDSRIEKPIVSDDFLFPGKFPAAPAIHSKSDVQASKEPMKKRGKSFRIPTPPTEKQNKARIENMVHKVKQTAKTTTLGDTLVTIWDFGGHSIFYTTHQMFLSKRFVYVLVFNLALGLHGYVQDNGLIPGAVLKSSVLEYMKFWVQSILFYTKDDQRIIPKIIVVGTHTDELEDQSSEALQKIQEKVFKEIERHFIHSPLRKYLHLDPTMCLNAKDSNHHVYMLLRKTIVSYSISQPYWGEELPGPWILLHHCILELKEKGQKIITYDEMKDINEQKNICPLDESELELFLCFAHNIGALLFFPEESLRKFIILDPRMMVDALCSLITDKRFAEESKSKHAAWEKLSATGMISEDDIKQIWEEERYKYHGFKENFQHILRTMERLDLAAKPVLYGKDGRKITTKMFYVPCMLKQSVLERPVLASHQEEYGFAFKYEGSIQPPAVYNRLVASCLEMFPVKTSRPRKDKSSNELLFSDAVYFQIDSFHSLRLGRYNDKIVCYIAHLRGRAHIDRSLTSGIREFLCCSLKHINQLYIGQEFSDDEDPEFVQLYPFTFHVITCYGDDSCIRDYKDVQANDLLQCRRHGMKTESKALLKYWFRPKEDPLQIPSIEECSNQCIGVTSLNKCERPTDKELGRLSCLLRPNDCFILGISMGLSEADREQVLENKILDSRQNMFYFIRRGMDKSGGTFEVLMKHMEHNEIDVHNLCKVYRECSSPLDLGENIPTDEQLDNIATYVGQEYFLLGLELGINHVDIERIQLQHRNKPLKYIREIFYHWRDNVSCSTKVKPSFTNLAKAFQKVKGNADCIKNVVDNF